MYSVFSQIMSGFSTSEPLEYICGFIAFIIVVGSFFRVLYSLFVRW